jgi:DNA polymerase
LTNPSVSGNGVCDSDQIGPWSLWQGNLNADLMIVGQDWGDEAYFLCHAGHDQSGNPTNKTLRKLLRSIGVEIEPPSMTDAGGGGLFFTNAILCLKTGGLQAPVDPAWFKNCGSQFLRPSIEIVRPRVLVTLGERAYRVMTSLYGLNWLPFKAAAEREDGFLLFGRTTLYPVYHCGARILNTHRPEAKQVTDWSRIGRALRAASPQP